MSEANSGRIAAKANEMYWHTSRPAGRLADELGISRSKFYALIEPLQLEATCSECGAPLTFNSRTDREAGRGRCTSCGEVTDVTPASASDERERPGTVPHPAHASEPADGVYGTRELWLTAIAGVATGMAITAWWRRR